MRRPRSRRSRVRRKSRRVKKRSRARKKRFRAGEHALTLPGRETVLWPGRKVYSVEEYPLNRTDQFSPKVAYVRTGTVHWCDERSSDGGQFQYREVCPKILEGDDPYECWVQWDDREPGEASESSDDEDRDATWVAREMLPRDKLYAFNPARSRQEHVTKLGQQEIDNDVRLIKYLKARQSLPDGSYIPLFANSKQYWRTLNEVYTERWLEDGDESWEDPPDDRVKMSEYDFVAPQVVQDARMANVSGARPARTARRIPPAGTGTRRAWPSEPRCSEGDCKRAKKK